MFSSLTWSNAYFECSTLFCNILSTSSQQLMTSSVLISLPTAWDHRLISSLISASYLVGWTSCRTPCSVLLLMFNVFCAFFSSRISCFATTLSYFLYPLFVLFDHRVRAMLCTIVYVSFLCVLHFVLPVIITYSVLWLICWKMVLASCTFNWFGGSVWSFSCFTLLGISALSA